MAQEITLDTLIEEHRNRMFQLIECESDPSAFFTDSLYYYEDRAGYENWLATAKRFIGSRYPHDRDVDKFEKVIEEKLGPNQQQKLLAILEAFRDVPEVIKCKQQEKDSSANVFNISNSNYQSQHQSQSVQIFFEAIKDELTGKQQRELKSIVDEDIEPETKRNMILDKLKSFGLDTLSSIVANIATNPAVWG